MGGPDWGEVRRHLRRRTVAQMALFVCPLAMLLAILKITEPMIYAPGDPRNDMAWRLLVYGGFIVIAVIALAHEARWLLAERRHRR